MADRYDSARWVMQIGSYGFGHITIDGQSYSKDVQLLPPRVLSPWWRREGHRLDVADLDEVIAYAPEVLLDGSGAFGRMKVPDETRQHLESRGMVVEVLATKRACLHFADLIAAGKRVAAALHLTC